VTALFLIHFDEWDQKSARPRNRTPDPLLKKPTDRFCQILPEEALPARFQQVGAISETHFLLCFPRFFLPFAAVFRNLRYVS